jgi:hypothetical protein
MAGLRPGHPRLPRSQGKDVDARRKAGHNEGRTSPLSRRHAPEVMIFCSRRPKEGAGNAGCFSAPAASCVKNKTHELVTTVAPASPGIPAREWF